MNGALEQDRLIDILIMRSISHFIFFDYAHFYEKTESEILTMTEDQKQWIIARGRMMNVMKDLGFPEALGDELVKNLGSPKAMDRMTSYLNNVKPKKAELVVDEMIAICSDIVRWKDKKELERANAKYNEILYFGLENIP